jgi:hypothetical protein
VVKKNYGDLHEQQEQPTQLICDNQSVIQMTKNLVFHKKTKHIDIQYHFVRDLVQQGVIEIMYCRTEEQLQISSPKHYQRKSSANSEMILEYFQMIIMGEKCWNNVHLSYSRLIIVSCWNNVSFVLF